MITTQKLPSDLHKFKINFTIGNATYNFELIAETEEKAYENLTNDLKEAVKQLENR